ncbi:VirC2 family conjugal transfer protein [Rhizobium mesoamericanum]|uniref:Uncharacterized protein n=1 Tax=Rhizobium mesoamericanum STM3625 TaxID=1211777 RepID=K0Q3T2_9HYPH|nr:VirC2 family conjugal transfer protein [Rhizobium mesoamericanum]CCM79580.1 hypothetical protein BN77_p30002 [Rhizobium mesoamericanum STM3625]
MGIRKPALSVVEARRLAAARPEIVHPNLPLAVSFQGVVHSERIEETGVTTHQCFIAFAAIGVCPSV